MQRRAWRHGVRGLEGALAAALALTLAGCGKSGGITVTERAALRGHTGRVTSLVVTPDGRTLVSGGGKVGFWPPSPGEVKLWDLPGGKERAALSGHPAPVMAVALGGGTLASASDDGTIKLWDLASGREAGALSHSGVHALALTSDGKVLASGSAGDGSIRLWDAATRKERGALFHPPAGVGCLAFTLGGGTLASAGVGVKLWDVTTARERPLPAVGAPANSRALAWSAEGAVLASGHGDATNAALPGAVRLWDAAAGTELATLPCAQPVFAVALSPDGKTLASGTVRGGVSLWDVAARREVTSFQAHEYGTFALAFTPDGRTLASGGGDGTVRLWDVAWPAAGR